MEWLGSAISTPFIFGMIVPITFLDLAAEVYHRICFYLYGIPYVDRGKYVRVDRHKLSYLPWYNKLFCLYCGYANGVLPYVAEIAAESERYWCAIKHQGGGTFQAPKHHDTFADYGDAAALETLENRDPRNRNINAKK